jgi:hypothetical protein
MADGGWQMAESYDSIFAICHLPSAIWSFQIADADRG